MQKMTFADLHAHMTDPHYRLASQRHQLQAYMQQAKIEQGERHHQEMMGLNRERMAVEQELRQIEAQASIEREHIKGANDRALSRQGFMLEQLGKASALVDAEYLSHFKEREDWGNNLARARSDLLTIEADTLRQMTLERLRHKQNLETMEKQYQLDMNKEELKHQFNIETSTLDYHTKTRLENQRASLTKQEKKLQHKQELEKLVLQYNLEILKKFLDSHLQDWRTTHTKASEIIFRLVEQMLGLGEQQVSECEMRRMYEDALNRAYP